MTNRLTKRLTFFNSDFGMRRLSLGGTKVPRYLPTFDDRSAPSQSSRNRVEVDVIPIKSVVLPQEIAVSGGTRHWRIWSFCQFCPQYANAVIFPRKCYYEAQCPIPALVYMITHHSPRAARPQSSTPTQCMLPKTIPHPSLDPYDDPPTEPTETQGSFPVQNSRRSVRHHIHYRERERDVERCTVVKVVPRVISIKNGVVPRFRVMGTQGTSYPFLSSTPSKQGRVMGRVVPGGT